MRPQLLPRQPPVGLGPHYTATAPTTLRITHHSGLSSESLKVRDASGAVVFTCTLGSGLHQRKEMKDSTGSTIFTTSTKVIAESRETKGSFVSGQEAFVATKKDIGGRTGIEVTFDDPLSGRQVLSVGSRHNIKSEATVEDSKGVLAIIKWDDLGMGFGGGKKSGDGSGTDYDVYIAPGVDVALMVVLCACYDTMRVETAVKLIGDIMGGM